MSENLLTDPRTSVINHLPSTLALNLIDLCSLSPTLNIDITNEHLNIFICCFSSLQMRIFSHTIFLTRNCNDSINFPWANYLNCAIVAF